MIRTNPYELKFVDVLLTNLQNQQMLILSRVIHHTNYWSLVKDIDSATTRMT